MTRIKMLRFRQGWFWNEALYDDREYELPDEVTEYLLGLGVAELVLPEPELIQPPLDDAPATRSGRKTKRG
jgi:hypothetical protein